MYHDPDWSNPQLKYAEEDNFSIPLPEGFFEAIHSFVFNCTLAMEETKYTFEDAGKAPSSHRSAGQFRDVTSPHAAYTDTVDTLGELLIRLKYWKNGVHESGATHISGSEYWAVVNILQVMRHTLSTSSSYALDKIYAHGNNYRINATNLYNAFVKADFAKGKASFMQPLYAEIKRIRKEYDKTS